MDMSKIKEELVEVIDVIVSKLTSARFLVTLGLTYTFCLISYKTLMLFFESLANEKVSGPVEKVAMFILGAFCTQFANVVTSYFGRTDRNGKDTNGESNGVDLNKPK